MTIKKSFFIDLSKEGTSYSLRNISTGQYSERQQLYSILYMNKPFPILVVSRQCMLRGKNKAF